MTIRFIPADKCVHAVVGALSGAVALVAAAVLTIGGAVQALFEVADNLRADI